MFAACSPTNDETAVDFDGFPSWRWNKCNHHPRFHNTKIFVNWFCQNEFGTAHRDFLLYLRKKKNKWYFCRATQNTFHSDPVSDSHTHKLYSLINFNLTALKCCWFGTFQSPQCIYIVSMCFFGNYNFLASCRLETLLSNQSIGKIPSWLVPQLWPSPANLCPW